MNVELFLVLLFISRLMDWVFQSNWQAINKGKVFIKEESTPINLDKLKSFIKSENDIKTLYDGVNNDKSLLLKIKFNPYFLPALLSHALTYALSTVLISALIFKSQYTNIEYGEIALILFITHILIDNSYIVKLIMRLQGTPKDELSNSNKALLSAEIDQRLHEVVLLAISFFF